MSIYDKSQKQLGVFFGVNLPKTRKKIRHKKFCAGNTLVTYNKLFQAQIKFQLINDFITKTLIFHIESDHRTQIKKT